MEIEYKYHEMLYGYYDSWLFCTLKTPLTGWLHLPSLVRYLTTVPLFVVHSLQLLIPDVKLGRINDIFCCLICAYYYYLKLKYLKN